MAQKIIVYPIVLENIPNDRLAEFPFEPKIVMEKPTEFVSITKLDMG